jgi:hypothetical protein
LLSNNGLSSIADATIETTFRQEHGRVLAALISQLGDFISSDVPGRH